MRRLLLLLTLFAMAASTAVATPEAAVAANPFTDIADSKFRSDIDWAFNNGITVGCDSDSFCPAGVVRRDQMASFLSRMFELPATTKDYFDDDDGNKHERNINRVAASGITVGCGERRYCASGVVTRSQMASFISRAADLSTGAGRNYFWDDNGNKHEANIDRFAAVGITTGCGEYRFCPNGSVTREQMAAFLHRVIAPRPAGPYPAPPPPCDPSYPGVCIPPPPPDLDCGDIPYRRFTVVGADPHRFDMDDDGIGCESRD